MSTMILQAFTAWFGQQIPAGTPAKVLPPPVPGSPFSQPHSVFWVTSGESFGNIT